MEFLVLVVGVAFIIAAIAWWKLSPFIALILAALLVGILSPSPLINPDKKVEIDLALAPLRARLEAKEIDEAQFEAEARPIRARIQGSPAVLAMELTAQEFGNTAAGIGIVIVLAALIGQCLMESGAADKITRRFLALLGERRAGLALLGSGYFLSIPVFFDTVFFLLVPLARALRMRTGKSYLFYILAIAAGGVLTHSLVPPTPGPLLMVDTLKMDLGKTILGGFLLGLPIALIFGLGFARWSDRRTPVPFREAPGLTHAELEALVQREEKDLPGFWPSILPVLLPVLLITGDSILQALQKTGTLDVSQATLDFSAFFGNKNIALFLAALCASWVLIRKNRLTLLQFRERTEPAMLSAGLIILITSAGGAFGKMLAKTGISDAIKAVSEGGDPGSGVHYLLLAWGIAAVMKLAQGSGTVSMITASGMMAAILGPTPALPYNMLYIFSAIAYGSLSVSWMNDSGFWVVCKLSGFTEGETLRTWTPLLIVLSLAGLVEVLIVSAILPLV